MFLNVYNGNFEISYEQFVIANEQFDNQFQTSRKNNFKLHIKTISNFT